MLPEVKNLAHDRCRRRPRGGVRRPGPVGQPRITVLVMALPPLEAGAVKATDALDMPAVAMTPVGAPGAVLVTTTAPPPDDEELLDPPPHAAGKMAKAIAISARAPASRLVMGSPPKEQVLLVLAQIIERKSSICGVGAQTVPISAENCRKLSFQP